MKLKITKYLAAAGMMALLFAEPQPAMAQTTQKLSANKTNEYGLIYTLPSTAIDVTIEAERTVMTPGEFYRYAGKYLSLTPITEKSELWRIKRVVIGSHGEADESQRYLVQFKSGSAPYIIINERNFPLSINTEKIYSQKEVELPVAVAAEPTILELPVARQAMTEEMLRSTSVAKRAELAAARIIELRQSRMEVISGQADAMPTDGEAMKLALDNMDAQEKALTAMFTGTEQTSTEVATFTVTPDSTDHQQIVVARLSATDGIVPATDLTGRPIYLDIDVTSRGKLPINERGEVKRFPKGGLAYRVAGRADVTVTYDGNSIATANLPLSQSGVVFGLDPKLFTDKNAPAYAVFNPSTGDIVELGTVAPAQ